MIFLDMDGVLCDFVSSAMEVFGAEYDPQLWPRGEWDIAKVLGVSVNEFWTEIDKCGIFFWSNLKPYPWFESLVKELQAIDEVIIATAPSRSPNSYFGKRQWLIDHGLGKLACMFGQRKELLAKPSYVLVDDGPHNFIAWEGHGGLGVMFPQPWNNRQSVPSDQIVEYVVREVIRCRHSFP